MLSKNFTYNQRSVKVSRKKVFKLTFI